MYHFHSSVSPQPSKMVRSFFISASHTEDEIRQVVQLIVDRPVVEPPRGLSLPGDQPAAAL